MAHEQLGLTNDELLSTTRAVRKRLDFDRPVGM
ncbi:MAG: nitroreductase, partial [Gammaproteobacteria bacterium]|nr:nitroreductase [Gammaproteobacteria bacterium]